mmetsp:Transcript_18516/g.41063  ORF Transcript_18516/g.41063 Transcript_18516/m.41063 type:complete len:305 (-) Transcript_18516:184-1098(-)
MMFRASSRAFSSSCRPRTEASWSLAFCMQSDWSSWSPSTSAPWSLSVRARSPSAVALVSLYAASAFFSDFISRLSRLISSCKDCSTISKLCLLSFSSFSAVALLSSALSNMSSRIWVTALLGSSVRRALASASSVSMSWSSAAAACSAWDCIKASREFFSWEVKTEASRRACRASVRPEAEPRLTCMNPAAAWRLRVLIARSTVSMVSAKLLSCAMNSSCSFFLTSLALARSASFSVTDEARSSILEEVVSMSASAFSMVPWRLSTLLTPLAISHCFCLALVWHQSTKASYCRCSNSPSCMTFC